MLELLKSGFDLLKTAIDLLEKPLNMISRRDHLLRLLYLENASNLELFSVVEMKAREAKTMVIPRKKAEWIIGNISTKVMETILLGGSEDFKSAEEIDKGNDRKEDDELDDENGMPDDKIRVAYLPENAFQIIRYLVIKIAFLRIALNPGVTTSDIFEHPTINYELRLTRIYYLMVKLQKNLSKNEAIRKMSRKGA
jgi:hypothetical protein